MRPLVRTATRLPLLAIALLAMAWGTWLGLSRLGWILPFLPWPDRLLAHGPAMIGGFLGTLICLERAVALAKPWAYAAPGLTASGALLLVLGPPGPAAALLIMIGSAVLIAVLTAAWRRQPSLFALTITIGAAAWFAGNAQWLAGAAIFQVVPWWLAFLLLTIAGERLELSRVLPPTRGVRLGFTGAVAVLLGGVALTTFSPPAGVRLMGAGMIALAWWLARHDIARRTVRQTGLPRFMAVCLLSGYAWLGLAGVVAVATAAATPGTPYDALLHAVLLGFVVSMVFGHAPVIFPAILGVPLPYRPTFYAHLGLLHGSVALRVVGDLVDTLGRWRVWGGLLNAFALLFFVLNTAGSIVAAVHSRRFR